MVKCEKTTLDWLLTFTQIDLHKIGVEKKTELDIGLSRVYCGLGPKGNPGEPLPWKWILEPFSKGAYQNTLFPGIHLNRIQKKLKASLDRLIKQKETPSLIVDIPPVKRSLILSELGYCIRYADPDELDIDTQSKIISPSGNSLIARFMEFFGDLPRDALRQCPECLKWFVHYSEKEKRYCTSLCASRAVARRRLEDLKKHPRKYDRYLKTQRERMKRRYTDKKRKEFPKAKIGRNVKK